MHAVSFTAVIKNIDQNEINIIDIPDLSCAITYNYIEQAFSIIYFMVISSLSATPNKIL